MDSRINGRGLVDDGFSVGEDELIEAMTKLAIAIEGVGKHLEHVQGAVEQKIKTNEGQVTDALKALTAAIVELKQNQASSAVTQAQGPQASGPATPPGFAPTPAASTMLTGEFGATRPAADPSMTTGQPVAPDPWRTSDPWSGP